LESANSYVDDFTHNTRDAWSESGNTFSRKGKLFYILSIVGPVYTALSQSV